MSVQFPQGFSPIGSVNLGTLFLADKDSVNGVVAVSVLKAFFDTQYATQAQGAKADTALQPAAIGTTVQPYAASLASIAGASANGISLVTAANYAAMRTLLSVYTSTQVDDAISSAIATLIGSAPGALDTLNELANALGDDPNFATTVTNALAGKQPLNSVLTTLTGASANGQSLVTAANYAAMKALLAVGVSDIVATGTPSGSTFLRGDGVWASPAGGGGGDLLAANNLSDVASASTSRTNLGLAIGTHVQAYSANLTTFAGIAPSANIQSLLAAADYAAARTLLSVYTTTQVDSAISAAIAALLDSAPGALDTLNELAAALGDDPNFASTVTTALAGKQPLSSTLTSLASASANGVSLVTAADYAAMRALLDLEAGTDFYSISAANAAFQPIDATLTALAAVTTAADKLIYASGVDTFLTTDFGSVARTLLAQTTQALMRTTGLGMSSDGSALVAAANYAAMKTALAIAQADVSGLTTASSPQFTAVNVGHASDTTIERLSAGLIGVEGKALGFRDAQQNAQTGTTYQLVAGDAGGSVTMENASSNTLTIPANATVAFATGTLIKVTRLGAGATNIAAASGVTINGVATGSGPITNRYQAVMLEKIGTNVWLVQGDIGTIA